LRPFDDFSRRFNVAAWQKRLLVRESRRYVPDSAANPRRLVSAVPVLGLRN
jgi:hypothetical protein